MAKKVTFRNRFESKRCKTLVDGVSLTIPNQSMTVKEIYNRYVVGAPLPSMSQRNLTSDPEELWDVVPDFDKMDLADIAEYSRNLAGKSAYLRKKLEERHKQENQRAEKKDEVPSLSDSAQQ